MLEMIKAVIFDLDGVLVDTEIEHEKAFKQVLSEFNITILHQDYKHYFFGKTDKEGFLDIFRKKGIRKYNIEECVEKKREIFLKLLNGISVFKGVIELLDKLKEKYKLALASNSPKIEVEKIINLKSIKKYFEVITSVDDVIKPKPDPEIYLKTAEKLKVSIEECIVIEDSVFGVGAGKRAGMTVIAIANTEPKKKLKEADFVVENLNEVNEIIKKIKQ